MKHLLVAGLAVCLATLAGASDAAATFDARNPADVLAVISSNGATGELKKDENGRPYIEAKTGALPFELDFYGCDANGATCSKVLYTIAWQTNAVSLDQVNRWNRLTLMCPAYLNTGNHPRAWYGVRPSASETSDDVVAELNIWLDCLSEFDKFTDAPEAYLKANE